MRKEHSVEWTHEASLYSNNDQPACPRIILHSIQEKWLCALAPRLKKQLKIPSNYFIIATNNPCQALHNTQSEWFRYYNMFEHCPASSCSMNKCLQSTRLRFVIYDSPQLFSLYWRDQDEVFQQERVCQLGWIIALLLWSIARCI